MHDVITIGSATVDCFAILGVDFKKIEHGEKVLIKDIRFLTGGGATNVGVGLSRLGIKTAFLGELGMDQAAEQIIAELKKEKIAIINKERSRHHTSYSIVLDTEKMDRAILAYKGASNYLHYDEFSKKKLNTKWFYFASMVDSSFKTLELLADFAVRHGIKVYFNPSSYMAEKGRRYLSKVLRASNIICLNREEAELLLGEKSNAKNSGKGSGENDIRHLLRSMYSLSPRMEIVIITEGKHGLHAFDGKEIFFVKPHPIKVVETTGAGDAFGTGFLAGHVMGKSMDFCLNLGLCEAESVIQFIGAKTGLLRKRQAFAELRRQHVI